MRIRGLGRLRQAVRRVRNSMISEVVLLAYHRVAEYSSDPWGICVTPRHFQEHLEVLRDYGCIMRLEDVVGALRKGTLPHRAVGITFDDGYADNLYNAKPLLERPLPAAAAGFSRAPLR